ncbi:MAG: preprotein translocase subunit YajC [Rikenellaceae bacterium]|jgi:preprotein translocase subunit YajC|nr:preprotein translocase subunit YajC [Rikenellaceae bacterium]
MNSISILLQAAPAAGSSSSGMSMILMMVAIFAIMWLLMIRPQQKKQKELVKFRQSLQSGDKVITAGGIFGVVREVKETYVLLEIDKNTDIRVEKSMIMKDTTNASK